MKISKSIFGWPDYRIAGDGTVTGPCGFPLKASGGCVTLYNRGKKCRYAVKDLLAAYWPETADARKAANAEAGPDDAGQTDCAGGADREKAAAGRRGPDGAGQEGRAHRDGKTSLAACASAAMRDARGFSLFSDIPPGEGWISAAAAREKDKLIKRQAEEIERLQARALKLERQRDNLAAGRILEAIGGSL